jgi:hypothetical protein
MNKICLQVLVGATGASPLVLLAGHSGPAVLAPLMAGWPLINLDLNGKLMSD